MFWHVRDGGVYLTEDLRTSYWSDYGGGFRNPESFIEARAKPLLDTVHAWHSQSEGFNVSP